MTDMESIARTGEFSDKRLRAYLDSLPLSDVMGLLGSGEVETVIHQTGWVAGSGRPALADEDPAVICAIARCWLARWRKDPRFGTIASVASHPEECGWCGYPADELIRVLEWAGHHAQYISEEWVVWYRNGAIYRRAGGRAGTYSEPRWRAFGDLSAADQRARVDDAVRKSRPEGPTGANAPRRGPMDPGVASGTTPPTQEAPARSHDAWCTLPPDHEGPCPDPVDE